MGFQIFSVRSIPFPCSTLGNSLEVVRMEMEKSGRSHMDVAAELKAQIEKPLSDLTVNQSTIRKSVSSLSFFFLILSYFSFLQCKCSFLLPLALYILLQVLLQDRFIDKSIEQKLQYHN